MYSTEGIYIGGIAGNNYGIISKCKNEANSELLGEETYQSENINIGGIVGKNYNEVIECVNKSTITGNQNTGECQAFIGGIVGWSEEDKVQYCYNKENLSSTKSGGCRMGVIIGWRKVIEEDTYVKNCYNIGLLSCYGAVYYSHNGN